MNQLPQQLLEDLEGIRGFDREAFLSAHGQAAVTSIRLHPVKGTGVPPGSSAVRWCEEGYYLSGRPVFTLDPAFHAGAYYVQEASSMFLQHVVKAAFPEREGLRVLDLCGAPGGKSTLLASMLGPSSLLLSNEVIRSRASILEENMIRWGYTNSWVTSNDPRDLGRLEGYFDLIVVDAPCSGSGLFRKDERALTEWSEANVDLCSQRQQRILADIWPALKEGGVLVYATCSYSPREDEEILNWLLGEFGVGTIDMQVPEEWGIVEVQAAGGLKGFRFFPHRVAGEGFFIAAVRKEEVSGTMRKPRYKSLHDKKLAGQASFLTDTREPYIVFPFRDTVVGINPVHEDDFHLLQKELYLRKAGLVLGSAAGKDWIPAHEVALSIDMAEDLPAVALSKDQALRFLKKEECELSLPQKGWVLAVYDGLGLGWIKSLGNRYNNYLPRHWRIRMQLPSEWE